MNQRGSILVFELIIIFVFSLTTVALLGVATGQLRVLRTSASREQAFHIAEAGVNYYQWHLAHYQADFQDGTGAPPPAQQSPLPANCYLHDYIDKDTNQLIGRYCLEITVPLIGSTIVTIKSTGYTLANPKTVRTITTRYGIPSLAKYAFLTNSPIWIGDTESVSGEMHANGGIRFDGTGNAPISSSKSTYTCPNFQGCSGNPTKPGIWGAAPQSTQNFWDFPVPDVDFSSITSNLATLKTSAQNGGIYLAPSSAQGYSLVFNSNGTITIYKVTSLRSHATGWDVNGCAHSEDLDYQNRTQQDGNPGLAGTQVYVMPANGVIYIEDKTWVEGTVSGRALVAAAKLPYVAPSPPPPACPTSTPAPSILIPNNLVYAAKDGTNVLGLIAQQEVLLTYLSPNNLEIDAAMIAQNGSAQHYAFTSSCSPSNVKNSITTYGAISSYGVWTWSWVCGSTTVSGYQNTTTLYDANLLYGPPPSFPLTTGGYQQISWSSN